MSMTKVTQKGQVTIPKAIREELGIQPGDEITFEEVDGEFVLRKAVPEDRFEKWRGAADTDQTVGDRMTDLRGRREDT